MKYQLDSTDRRILEKLMEDSSKSLAQIARELGLPRPTVNYRIQRMKREGIIRKFTVLRDYDRLGQGLTTFIFVRYQTNPDVSQRKLAEALAQLPEVYEVHLLTGEWDILLKVRTGSLDEVTHLVVDRLRNIRGVERTLTCNSLGTVKEDF